MIHYKWWWIFFIVFVCLSGCTFLQDLGKPRLPKSDYYVGLRRSSYGLPAKNGDDAWWSTQVKAFATSFPNLSSVHPTVIQIVSIYTDEGGTQFEFEKPEDYTGTTENMTFQAGAIDHEHALSTYDEQGIKTILQFEPGNADVLSCFDIAQQKFGHHPCIIGYGIDAEWYFTKESKSHTGLPIPDEVAEQWVAKVRAFNPAYMLFLKHWLPSHLPQTYRHPNLWFLSDSQDFKTLADMMAEFGNWSDNYKDQIVGYQYGYESDRRWWKKLKEPTREISKRILRDISNTRCLFWVDFTASNVTF